MRNISPERRIHHLIFTPGESAVYSRFCALFAVFIQKSYYHVSRRIFTFDGKHSGLHQGL
jgi:hypothetical protein